MAKRKATRRYFLSTGLLATTIGLTGCSQLTGTSDSEISDTDGDGVINKEDYAPRDASVQRKEQILSGTSTETPENTETATPSPESTQASQSGSLVFEDGFEDGKYSQNWSIVWKNFPEIEPTNEWGVTQDLVISGDYSLHLNAYGDPNILATNNRVIELDKNFDMSIQYYLPKEDNRGPGLKLIYSIKNGSKGNYVETLEIPFGSVRGKEGAYGNGAGLYKLFGKTVEIEASDLTLGEPHEIRVSRVGDRITGYHDGSEIVTVHKEEISTDLSKPYRFALRNSGTWGSRSHIYFDNFQYRVS